MSEAITQKSVFGGETKGIQKVNFVLDMPGDFQKAVVLVTRAEGESWLKILGFVKRFLWVSHNPVQKNQNELFGQPNTTVGGVKRYS